MATRVTKQDLARRDELIARATALRAQASTLSREADLITEAAEADLVASGRDSVTRGGYRLTWSEGRASIAWKTEFVRRLGADLAGELQASAPKPRKLMITPPADTQPETD